jgi:hypothetical protein
MNSPSPFAFYVEQFLRPSNRSPPNLGLAIKLHAEKPDQTCDATNFLYYLLKYSPAPDTIAKEILGKCESIDSVRPIGRGRIVALRSY